MEEVSNMSELYSAEWIEGVADAMVVHPAFVEKDYYAVRILQQLSTFECLGHRLVFTGGTSLSKGYGLIERFSEDLDFEIADSARLSRSARRTIRHAFAEAVQSISDISIINQYAEDEGRKHTILISYPRLYPLTAGLREHLKLELFFAPGPICTEERLVRSFLAEYSQAPHADVAVLCNHPLHIMADKFNAITWRIGAAENGQKFDYTLMRHLHDLCAIHARYGDAAAFSELVWEYYRTKDIRRLRDMSFVEAMNQTRAKLTTDATYKQGYEQFVDSMSYAADENRISYEKAYQCYLTLCGVIVEHA